MLNDLKVQLQAARDGLAKIDRVATKHAENLPGLALAEVMVSLSKIAATANRLAAALTRAVAATTSTE